MTDFLICVLNHKTRDCTPLKMQLDEAGVEYKIFTDESDYYSTRDDKRYWGVVSNYFSILSYETYHDWKLIIHDDVEINMDAIKSIKHVLQYAPKTIVSFYNPTNKSYLEANKNGNHVLKTFSNWWGQCHAMHRSIQSVLSVYGNMDWWWKRNGCAEDGFVHRLQSQLDIPTYVIVPGLAQHIGYDKSTFKNPYKTGKYLRNSATYNSRFDVTSVDWPKHFKNPYKDNKKIFFDKKMKAAYVKPKDWE